MTGGIVIALVLGLVTLCGVLVWAYGRGSRGARAEERADTARATLGEIADASERADKAAGADTGDVNDGLRGHGQLRD